MLERLPVVSSGKLVDALRARFVTVGRTDILSIETCRMAAANDAGSTTWLTNTLSTPV